MLKDIEDLNITIQTLDGILAHNGEMLENLYEPDTKKTKEEFLDELDKVFKEKGYSKKIKPMTLEGSVVRISDIIAYIGRDIEDAITIGTIKREEVPKGITNILGDTNSQIVNNLILDIVKNSIDSPSVKISKDVFEALMDLKTWNYKYIYYSEEATKNRDILEKAFNDIYYFYLEKLDGKDSFDIKENMTYSEKSLYSFINERTKMYRENTDPKRIIIDYISGQTDKFFINECMENLENFKLE